MFTQIKNFFRRESKQYTWCYCPGCKEDLVSNPEVQYTDTDLVRYTCPCGTFSEWSFDIAPCPILLYVDGSVWRPETSPSELFEERAILQKVESI